jgi:hypothetical protein
LGNRSECPTCFELVVLVAGLVAEEAMAPPAPLFEPTAPSLEEETISRLLEVTPFHRNPRPLAPRLLLAGGYGAQDTPLLFYTWCGKKNEELHVLHCS